MKAVVVRKFGGPEVLSWEDVATPTAGPGEVVISVRAVSVNRTLDLQVRQDGGNYGVTLPLVLGNDPSGVVVEAGPDVDQPQVNDRVAIFRGIRCGDCDQCREGDPGRCARPRMLGVHVWGGYAEYLRIPAINCVPLPDGLPFSEATVITRHFPLAFGEARKSRLKKGEWALVMGAAGGLGSCLVQVAKSLGARVIAAAGSDDRVRMGISLGADAGINYRAQDLEQEVERLTDGQGVDVVFENIGDPSLWPAAFSSLASDGRLVTAGAHGGGMVTLDVRRLYQQRLHIMGGLGAELLEDLERSLQLGAEGKFVSLIDRVMPLYEAPAAHRIVGEGQILGKVILDPSLP